VLVFTGTAKPINSLAAAGSTLLAGSSSGIYRSTSNGSSWDESAVTGLPMVGSLPFLVKCAVNALAGNNTASVAGTDFGIYRSTDGGATWSSSGLSGSAVSVLTAVPGSSTFLAIAGGSAYRSTDNGSSWTAISGLSGGTPTAFAAHPSDGKTLYVGTNAGAVLQSTDGGSTWAVISDATTANQAVQALAVPASDPTSLVAATSGGTFLYTAGPAVQPAFSFTSQSSAPLSTTITSDAITVTGLTAPASISIQGGQYRINDGAYTSAPGLVVNGAKVTVQLTSSADYSTTTSATLTIGKNSGKFEVTTLKRTVLTDVTQVLSTSVSGATITSQGILQLTTVPTAPVQIRSDAPTDALIQTPVNNPVQMNFGGATITVTPTTTSTVFSTQKIQNNVTGVTVASGSADISGSQSFSLPISTNTLNLPSGGSLQMGVNSGQTSAGILSGTATISFTGIAPNQFSAGGSTTVYGGETVSLTQTGLLKELRIGSLNGDKAVAGDPLTLANLDSGVKVPKLDGNLTRLSNTASLIDVIKGALDSQFGGAGTASYDAATGIFTYTLGDKTYRFIPIGSATVPVTTTAPNNSNFSATNAASAASGAFTLTNRGVQITLSSALGYFTELDQAIKGYDPKGSFKLRSDGTLKLQLLGLTAVAAPGSAVTSGTATGTPAFGVDADNRFTFVDSKGSSQTFYPVFADTSVLTTTLLGLDTKATATYLGNGVTQVVAPNWQFTFKPEYFLSTPDAAHASELWWLDGSKVVLRYPDNTSQAFGL
jgi:photosystem II stability/assembly factor-like uncharacterized protein